MGEIQNKTKQKNYIHNQVNMEYFLVKLKIIMKNYIC